MITPLEKIELMRLYATNPATAILQLAQILKSRITADVLQKVKSEVTSLEKILQSIHGEDGVDSSPEDVAKILLETPGFLDMIKGEQGIQGERGLKGDTGKQGIQGIQGIAGKDGENGQDGAQGEQGIQGVSGKDGSPDKPLEIAAKLNTTEETVEISVIKGLRNLIKNLTKKDSGKSKGGGMGNVQHESKSVSSTTTTVATNYKIAAGGNALWVYYNGQFLMKTVHYNVGTDQKTITPVITFDDGTKLDITYIRT